MEYFCVIRIEWNEWNSFIFDIININEKCLFGLGFSKEFLIIDLFFKRITIFDKTLTP